MARCHLNRIIEIRFFCALKFFSCYVISFRLYCYTQSWKLFANEILILDWWSATEAATWVEVDVSKWGFEMTVSIEMEGENSSPRNNFLRNNLFYNLFWKNFETKKKSKKKNFLINNFGLIHKIGFVRLPQAMTNGLTEKLKNHWMVFSFSK